MTTKFLQPNTVKETEAMLENTLFQMENHFFYAKDITIDVFYFYCYIWKNHPNREKNDLLPQMEDVFYVHSEDLNKIFTCYSDFIKAVGVLLETKHAIQPKL